MDGGHAADAGIVDGGASTADGGATADGGPVPDGGGGADGGPGGLCEEAADCTSPQDCVGGACMDPVTDLEGYAAQAATHPASYVWALQLPALYPQAERCCFDYNGDANGNPDDGLGSLLAVLGSIAGNGEVSPQETLDAAIAEGHTLLVTEWRAAPTGPGLARLSFIEASNDLDGDGLPDQPFADGDGECTEGTRCGGDGRYLLEPGSFGGHGAKVQFNAGVVEGGLLSAGPSTFDLELPFTVFSAGSEPVPQRVTLQRARIEATLEVRAGGVWTVDETRGEGTEDAFFVGGGKLGGVIDFDELGQGLDAQLRGCACAAIDPSQPVLAWQVDLERGALTVSCTDNVGEEVNACDGQGEGDGPLCPQVGTICGFAGFIGNVLDVDLDGDGINEALSAGFRYAWSGAALEGLLRP